MSKDVTPFQRVFGAVTGILVFLYAFIGSELPAAVGWPIAIAVAIILFAMFVVCMKLFGGPFDLGRSASHVHSIVPNRRYFIIGAIIVPVALFMIACGKKMLLSWIYVSPALIDNLDFLLLVIGLVFVIFAVRKSYSDRL